jgi:GT2 family glycosyltransferase
MTAPVRISIVIPAYFSHITVGSCLEALRRQTRPADEIIVVNSSPEQTTREVVTGQHPEVRFIQSPTRLLPHAARNRGIQEATGDLLVCTDPDCMADPAWLASLVDAFQAGADVVAGAMGLLQPGDWWEQGVHLTKFSWCLIGLPAGTHWIAPTANACYSRRAWSAIGPFDAGSFHGDALQSWRAARAGFPPQFVPGAIVRHYHGGSAASFWKERVWRGGDFAFGRARFERWAAARAFTHLLLTPLRLLLTLLRAAADALRAGWFGPYLRTLPIQFLGQLGWTFGEAKGFWRYAFAQPLDKGDAPG